MHITMYKTMVGKKVGSHRGVGRVIPGTTNLAQQHLGALLQLLVSQEMIISAPVVGGVQRSTGSSLPYWHSSGPRWWEVMGVVFSPAGVPPARPSLQAEETRAASGFQRQGFSSSPVEFSWKSC